MTFASIDVLTTHPGSSWMRMLSAQVKRAGTRRYVLIVDEWRAMAFWLEQATHSHGLRVNNESAWALSERLADVVHALRRVGYYGDVPDVDTIKSMATAPTDVRRTVMAPKNRRTRR